MKNKMNDEVFLSDYTYKFCYNYINELYLDEVKKIIIRNLRNLKYQYLLKRNMIYISQYLKKKFIMR